MSTRSSCLVTYSFAISSRVLFINISCLFNSVEFCLILYSNVANTNVINTTGNTGDTTELVYDPPLNKFYHIYRENYVGKFTPLTLSGTSVTRGTTVNSRNGNSVADQSVAYDSASNRFLFAFQNGSSNVGL